MEPDGFWDRNDRFRYLVACENARRIRADPTLVSHGLAHLNRFAADDPRQARGVALWKMLLALPAAEIAESLVERSERGDYVRATAPAFGPLNQSVRARLVRQARSPIIGTVPHEKVGGIEPAR